MAKGRPIVAHPAEPRSSTRTLANAAILQIVPSLRDGSRGRAAVEMACALMQNGAQVFVAGESGPLVGKLQTAGGEWIPLASDTMNPLKLRRNAKKIERLISAERIDLIHAYGAGAAWSALSATANLPVRVVTSLPDALPAGWLRSFFFSALTRGDRVIAPSSFAAERAITQFKIPPERIEVIPRSIDTRLFDPAAVDSRRLSSFRNAARIHRGERVILVPARLSAAKGQHVLVEAAAILADRKLRGCVYVLAGDDHSDRLYVHKLAAQIKKCGLEPIFRIISTFDLRAALAASHLVVVPALEPAVTGRVLTQAQAMARPVIATQIGLYPEQVLAPPRMPDELRTGWLVPRGQPADLAGAIGAVMDLDETAYQALAARAHQYARFAFSPESVVAATRAVYTGLLAGQG